MFSRAGQIVPLVCIYTLTGRVYKIHVKRRKSKNFNQSINFVVIVGKKSFMMDIFQKLDSEVRI